MVNTDITERLSDAPDLSQVVAHICAKSPFQKKAMARNFSAADPGYIAFADGLVSRLLRAVERGPAHDYLADAYLAYTKQIRIEEMYFAKEHTYRLSRFEDAYREVYSRDDYMFDYVVGLGMTQILWPNHWAIVQFYVNEFLPLIGAASRGAEVGVGHGLFHAEMLRAAPEMRSRMLDISPTSLEMTRRMIVATGLDPKRAEKVECDIQKGIPVEDASLDVLLMGELIEHIENGAAVLGQFTKKMKPGGLCFFTTAANAPAEDHILLFRTTGEIREVVSGAGWKIKKEHLGTLNGMSVEEAEADGHNINYAAVIAPR